VYGPDPEIADNVPVPAPNVASPVAKFDDDSDNVNVTVTVSPDFNVPLPLRAIETVGAVESFEIVIVRANPSCGS
jgi:hypothetical protein